YFALYYCCARPDLHSFPTRRSSDLADLSNKYIWVVLMTTMLFGVIGWVDDYKKVVNKDPNGLKARYKYLFQSIIGLAAALVLYRSEEHTSELQSRENLVCRLLLEKK